MSPEFLVIMFLISLCGIAGVFFWKHQELTQETKKRIQKALSRESQEPVQAEGDIQDKESVSPEEPTKENVLSIAEQKRILRRAEVLLARKRNKDAEKLFIRILSFEPGHQAALQRLAYLYLQTEAHAKSESLYKQLSEMNSKNSAIFTNLGLVLFRQEKYDESIGAYKKAIELEPHRAGRHANLGQVYFVTNDFDAATECFRIAVQKDPRNTEFLYLLANACVESKKFAEARKWYERILDLSPYDDSAKEAIRRLKVLGF